MSTKEEKNSNNRSNSEIKNESTQSSESKFSEEPQNNLNSSESGQKFHIVEETPFVAVEMGGKWALAIGNQVASERRFKTPEEAEAYALERPWDLIWMTAIWVINNQEKCRYTK